MAKLGSHRRKALDWEPCKENNSGEHNIKPFLPDLLLSPDFPLKQTPKRKEFLMVSFRKWLLFSFWIFSFSLCHFIFLYNFKANNYKHDKWEWVLLFCMLFQLRYNFVPQEFSKSIFKNEMYFKTDFSWNNILWNHWN